MIWIALLLIACLILGLRERMTSRHRHLLVFLAALLTVGGMYLTFASP